METPKAVEVANLCTAGIKGYNEMNGRIYAADTAQNNGLCCIEPCIGAMRGRSNASADYQQQLEVGGECANAVTTVQKDNMVIEPSIRVRKLTPRENWRLMGFDDEAFDRAAAVNSNSQLYKQAGNSIVVDVLMAIFREML